MSTSFETQNVKALLYRACEYLRKSGGRTATEGPRRILTAASQIVGTDIEGVNLKQTNIVKRVKI